MGPPLTGARAQDGCRPADYYTQSRPDVAALVPPACTRVLEVGCARGHLGALLAARGHRVTGVELVAAAAAEARTRLPVVVQADVEAGPLPFAPGSFDCVVFADVLEHLVDPWRVLREAAALLRPGGCVVASLPNVQHGAVVWRLARGRWDYRDRGILDRGHLRFFTRRSVQDLFRGAGLGITHVGHNYRRTWWRSLLTGLTLGRARAFLTRQYLVVGRRPGGGA